MSETPDPLRMYLVVRRGAVDDLSGAGALAGAAAVACVRAFEADPEWAEAFAAWRPRPGKVCLRARGGQWDAVLEEPHAVGGDGVICLPPRRRSARGPLLERLQAMSSELDLAPEAAPPLPGGVTYALNPRARMSSGKTLAQVAHAAVLAADGGRLEDWVAAGCPGQVIAPGAAAFDALAGTAACVGEVVDAGLTEVPPGTITVRALAPPG